MSIDKRVRWYWMDETIEGPPAIPGKAANKGRMREMIFKSKNGKTYKTKFMWQGKMICRSTKTRNKKLAAQIEANIKSELAKGHWGTLDDRKPELTLAEFLKDHFVTGEIQPKTREYYDYGITKLFGSDLAKLPLSKVTKQDAQRVCCSARPASG